MPLEFVFKDVSETSWDSLQQGDILVRNDGLRDALAEAHQYYASADDYKYFMVLTQTCDLAWHGKSRPRSPYITIAATRPLRCLMDRTIEKYDLGLGTTIRICAKKHEERTIRLLERLLHNTEPTYFFVKAGSPPNISEDLCVFLALSVALRISHFKACIAAKVAQLEDVFQAKVGWLTGNLYSRVGTPDLEDREDDAEGIKDRFYQDVLRSQTAWLTTAQVQELKQRLKAWRREHPGEEVDTLVLRQIIGQIPDDITILAERAASQLAQRELLAADAETLSRAARVLLNDKVIQRILRGD